VPHHRARELISIPLQEGSNLEDFNIRLIVLTTDSQTSKRTIGYDSNSVSFSILFFLTLPLR
jgi:hypothetical protein